MKNITFVDQSIPLPDGFQSRLEHICKFLFPRTVVVSDMDSFLISKRDKLREAIQLNFPKANIRDQGTNPTSIEWSIDAGVGDTGFAMLALPITFENGAVYVGGVS